MRYVFIAALAAFFMSGPSAHAVPLCAPHEAHVDQLKGKYQETRIGLGLAGDGRVVELFISKSGTWSVLATRTDGVSCLVAAGQGWQVLAPQTEEKEKL